MGVSILVCCTRMFRVLGHDKVWVLDGGFPQWQASGFNIASSCPDDAVLKSKAANSAVETAYNGKLANAATFQTEFRPQLFWTLEKAKTTRVREKIAARSKGRFDGVMPEPREGVRSGHIPGTKCVPFPEMFDGAQTLLPADELSKKFEQEGILLDHPIVVTCGSGVTACILALHSTQIVSTMILLCGKLCTKSPQKAFGCVFRKKEKHLEADSLETEHYAYFVKRN
uniref:Rhodanese domain-containing protein n=1 Tax=Aegilops tauschii TaxID=37682 RepID=M8BUY5_AEGTA